MLKSHSLQYFKLRRLLLFFSSWFEPWAIIQNLKTKWERKHGSAENKNPKNQEILEALIHIFPLLGTWHKIAKKIFPICLQNALLCWEWETDWEVEVLGVKYTTSVHNTIDCQLYCYHVSATFISVLSLRILTPIICKAHIAKKEFKIKIRKFYLHLHIIM